MISETLERFEARDWGVWFRSLFTEGFGLAILYVVGMYALALVGLVFLVRAAFF